MSQPYLSLGLGQYAFWNMLFMLFKYALYALKICFVPFKYAIRYVFMRLVFISIRAFVFLVIFCTNIMHTHCWNLLICLQSVNIKRQEISKRSIHKYCIGKFWKWKISQNFRSIFQELDFTRSWILFLKWDYFCRSKEESIWIWRWPAYLCKR